MKETLYASFADILDAERATGALLDYGLNSEDISLIAHERHADRVNTYTGEVIMHDSEEDLAAKTGISTTTSADAASAALTGSSIGLGVGVAIALASVFVPGIGLVVGGGALSLALAGVAGATGAGAVAGGVLGYLKDQGVPDQAVAVYHETFQQGGAILAVTLPADVTRTDVVAVLNKYNAQNIGNYGYVTTN